MPEKVISREQSIAISGCILSDGGKRVTDDRVGTVGYVYRGEPVILVSEDKGGIRRDSIWASRRILRIRAVSGALGQNTPAAGNKQKNN